jgi:hypothetical protein
LQNKVYNEPEDVSIVVEISKVWCTTLAFHHRIYVQRAHSKNKGPWGIAMTIRGWNGKQDFWRGSIALYNLTSIKTILWKYCFCRDTKRNTVENFYVLRPNKENVLRIVNLIIIKIIILHILEITYRIFYPYSIR